MPSPPPSNDQPMPRPQISIIGAGIAGLTLGRSLARHKIPYTISERDSAETARKRHRYGITLEPKAYGPLLDLLNLDVKTFRDRLAVDGGVGGKGSQGGNASSSNSAMQAFRANRQKLETLLSQDLEVRYEHVLSGLTRDGKETTLTFTNGREVKSNLVIAADGVHSPVRNLLDIKTELKTLPFAVYRGKRLLKAAEDGQAYRLLLTAVQKEGTVLQHRHGQTLLQMQIDELTAEQADLTYIYSRPGREPQDPLYKPARSKSDAKETPTALFDEVAQLSGLPHIFAEIFNADRMRKDRLLNWLMRSLPPPSAEAEMTRAAQEKGVVLLGDSVHAMPILGSYGANAAIEDALALGDRIAEKGVEDIGGFYQGRVEGWRQLVEEGEARLAGMHAESSISRSSNL
ncbi:hypothetical protein LTR86_002725 [Recurvomyces mirabilis]|nr:hypothetical protein LTR86_002725 [Recurvomyces mirabilis]